MTPVQKLKLAIIDSSDTWYAQPRQIYEELIEMGHECLWMARPNHEGAKKTVVPGDYTSVCIANNLSPIDISTNAPLSLSHPPLERAYRSEADFIFVGDKTTFLRFFSDRPNVFYMPYAVDTTIYQPLRGLRETYDVGFIGNSKIEERARRLALIQERFSCLIGSNLYMAEANQAMNRCRVVFNTCDGKEINMRVFEALATGKLLVTEKVDYLDELFKEGTHLVTYSREDEIVERIGHFLNRENERNEIAGRGLEEVRKYHTYRHRAEFIVEKILQMRLPVERVERRHTRNGKTYRVFYERQSEANRRAQERLFDPSIPDPDAGGKYNIRERLKEALNVSTGKVLDIGCQRGGYCHHLKKAGLDVTGIDISYGYLKMAAQNVPDARFILADAQCLPFKNESFDTVILSEILEHVIDEEHVVSEVTRVLKPKGAVFVTVPAYEEPAEEHVRFLSKKKLSALFNRYDKTFPDNYGIRSTILIARKSAGLASPAGEETRPEDTDRKGASVSMLDFNRRKDDLPMNILLSTNHLFAYTGSEITLYTIAKCLKESGHSVSIFAKYTDLHFIGIFDGIAPVFDDIKKLVGTRFDAAYVQHHPIALEIRHHFPHVPILLASLGILPFLEQPPLIDLNITRYLAISEEVRDNLIRKGISGSEIELFRNVVDSRKFMPEGSINSRPLSAVIYSYKIDAEKQDTIMKACERLNIHCRRFGDKPGAIDQNLVSKELNRADIVFTLGRGAIETMMCGRIPIIFDYQGGDGVVSPENIHNLMTHNFSGRRYGKHYQAEELVQIIRQYNPLHAEKLRTLSIELFDAVRNVNKLSSWLRDAAAQSPSPDCESKDGIIQPLLDLINTTKEFSEATCAKRQTVLSCHEHVPRESDATKDRKLPASLSSHEDSPKLIAFYLPQYHPIPENDAWWGRGFTEWTNVAKAKPLFHGHAQPHLPGELGYYDLRIPEVRKAQAELARAYGIEGFCYYHYWFNGKLLLERPLREVLTSGEPDFPFCLCWANENWTRTWDGSEDHVLIEQKYSEEDDRAHIRHLCEIFRDRRYIRVDGKPLFLVYRANRFPDPLKTTTLWREEALRSGIGDLFLCRVESFPDEHTDPQDLGFDAAVEFQPDWTQLSEDLRDERLPGLSAFRYEKVVDRMLEKDTPPYRRFPCVTPSWDNTPRRKRGGLLLTGSSPAQYGRWLRGTLKQLEDRDEKETCVFINAWNEWGEGNHLEPDARFGRAYLEATKSAVDEARRGDRGRAAEAHEGILKLLVAAGKRAEAVFALEHLLGSFPDYAPACNDLGVLYGESGDFPKALAAYEKAVSLDSANATFRKNLGDFHYVALKQPEEAVYHYEQALRLNPQDIETLLILGNLRVESGQFREAKEHYLRVLEMDPVNELAGRMFDALNADETSPAETDVDTLYREARSLVQRGRQDEAIGTLEELLRACPEHSQAQNDLGCLLFGRGEAEKARIHYEKAVAADPNNITALKNLADVYFVEAGRLEDALQLYHRILQEQPRDVEALKAIGSICVQLERYTDAAEIFRLIRSLDPADEESVRILENLGALSDSVPPASPPRHQPGDGLICHYPFHFMQIFYDKVYFCCPDWSKFSIGNLREQSLAEIWNSPTARFIRQKMYRNEWEDICNPCCPYIAAHRASGKRIPYASLEDYRVLTPGQIRQIRSKHEFMEHPPTGFKIDNSNTCNLDCLMCTRHANADDPELIRKTEAEIAPFLPTAKVIYLTGNGEPLAIRHTREMICGDYSFNPDLEFNLITNGLLLPKFWDRIQHQKFGDLMISIDAATKTTYEKIRRGGTWESLMNSLALVKCNRDRFRSVTINMTVMRENYREIPAFIDLAAAFGFSASFQRIRGTFDEQNIFDPAEREALRELGRIIRHEAATRQDAPVSWGDLIDFTASGNPDFAKDAPHDTPSPMQAADSANSIGRNRQYWSLYDWTERGNEWSAAWGGTENLWRGTILPRIGALLPAGHILEIAPGYGRCTQYLATQCRSMTLVDLTEKCIEACKQRFHDLPNIRYIVNDGKSLEAVENESVDFVFSWDSLVHVEKDVMEAYLHQLASKLKTGGMGFLHHSNIGAFRNPFTGELSVENRHWRGESMSAELFRAYCREAGLRCLSQEIIAWGGEVLNDCFSVITKGSAQPDQTPRVVENPHFMQEASGRGNPPDFYRALGIRKGSFAAATPEESYRKARGFIEESKFTEAARALEDYLLARPGDALAHNDLGCLYYRIGEREKTTEHYEKAVELEPGNATYLKNLADFYHVEQGRTDDALRLYRRILADHPGDVEALLALGHVCIALARLDDARTFFERALASDPGNETARTILEQFQRQPDRAPAADGGEGPTSVSIIIPAGDDPKTLSRCIGTVLQNTEGADYEIVLTSGLAPAGGEESFVPAEEKNIRLTALPVNGNPVAALNAAVRKASGRYLVFMDPRIVLSRGWLEPLLKTAVSNPMAAAVSSRVGIPPNTLIEAGYSIVAGDSVTGHGVGARIDAPRYNYTCETPSGSRFLTLVSRAGWEQCGGFDEQMTDFGMALMDLSLSIRGAGKALVYQPLSAVGLAEPSDPAVSGKIPSPEEPGRLSRLRPATLPRAGSEGVERNGISVLVLGVYLADRINTAEDIIAVLSESRTCSVKQCWVALGNVPPSPALEAVTVKTIMKRTPKFQIVNDLLSGEDLSRYDYVLLTDDDVVMPEGFLDAFIGLQEKLGFAIAQPARTSNSYIDHPIVEQANGLLARETRFVEIGPVVSFHRSVYDLVFPFDLASPMGWGYENVWSFRMGERGKKMGILDATPVDHSIRKPVENYDWGTADRQRTEFLGRNAHLPIETCFTTVRAIRHEGEPG